MLKRLKLDGFLSFAPESSSIELGKLNVLIGPNGSGKSNLIDSLGLLRSAPSDITSVPRGAGGVGEWLWRDGAPGLASAGSAGGTATVEMVLAYPSGNRRDLLYSLAFSGAGDRFTIEDERIENSESDGPGYNDVRFYYRFQRGRPIINVQEAQRSLRREDVDLSRSILEQRRDPEQYPELTYLSTWLSSIRLYRDWSFGRGRMSPVRMAQPSDAPNGFLLEDASNLGLVLNSLQRLPESKAMVLEGLRSLMAGVQDFGASILGGAVQLYLQEGTRTHPASRLSDGTLRYLALLAVLCHPDPGSLVCIEEPELGLHPDLLPFVADLMVAASERVQLVVTTHSEIIVDSLTRQPESVFVCERGAHGSEIVRLESSELAKWLKDYRLGALWRSGELGGNRW